MRLVRQNLDAIADSLTEMEADWLDETAQHVIATLARIEPKIEYDRRDLTRLLDEDFETALTIFRLFADLSKDAFQGTLPELLGAGGAGVKRYMADRERYLDALVSMGIASAMTDVINRPLTWHDLLRERLKGGRGRAVRGQARGRSLEDFVEQIVRRVFADGFDVRCSFVGRDRQRTSKADFAIPSRDDPRIVLESKGYAATGSKQTDVLGDLRDIIATKRPDTTLLFVTDGLTWKRRLNDLRKIVELQNGGEVARIYTRAMAAEMEADLRTLKAEHAL